MNSESALRSRRGCSPFGEAEMESFKARLLEREEVVTRSLAGLSEAALRPPEAGSSVPVHPADLAAESFDQEMLLGGMDRAQEELIELRGALERIENRSYGLCNDCGGPIPAARLEALPAAEYCIACKSRLEAA